MPSKRPGDKRRPPDPILAAERLLKIRPRSVSELRSRLLYKGFAADVIESLLDVFQKKRILDDVAFASWWITQRTTLRPTGSFRLTQELRKKGIDREVIDRVLAASGVNEGERELAEAALRPRLDRLRKLPLLEQRKKIESFLLRRGFSRGVIYEIIHSWEGKRRFP